MILEIANDMRTTLLLFTFLFICFYAGAQSVSRQVLSNAGNPIATTGMSINFTLGEPIVGLVSNENEGLDQGFWAGYLFLEMEETALQDLVLFPIPVRDILHIVPGDTQVFGFQLYSMLGQQLLSRVFEGNDSEIQVDLSTMANATYLAKVFVQGETTARDFKIIKH